MEKIKLLVLNVIKKRDMYSYQIIKEIEVLNENIFHFNEGSLYPVLHTLEKEKFLESYWEDTTSAGKKKYYKVTKHSCAYQ